MSAVRNRATVAFIGGGPRGVGLVERLIANIPLLAPETELTILIFDPHPAGPGRIWRYDQSPSLKMNSLAEDVALFNDPSCAIEGPLAPGPTLAEWISQVRDGVIPFTPPDPRVAAELAVIGPQGFATRRLLSCYLRWFFEHAAGLAPEQVTIREIRARVERVIDSDSFQTLEYRDAAGLTQRQAVDFVVYTVGHTDSQPTAAEQATLRRSRSLGLRYWPADYASEADFAAVPAGEPLLIRGLGLSFVDIVVRLTLDRGGREIVDPTAPAGRRSTYVASGAEPHIFAGSGRGVPYHSKITSHLHGEKPGLATTFLTREWLSGLLDEQREVDFTAQVWPTIVRELAYWHYREIFTGHPERVSGYWVEFSAEFQQEPFGSARLTQLIAQSVAPEDRFEIDALQHPLRGRDFASLADLQRHLTGYIRRDIELREAEEHSETLAVFWALLASYIVIGETLDHRSWSAQSRSRDIPGWWHHFFSYVDSGPPAERLELILALMRAGLLTFLGGDTAVEIDAERGAFVATGGNHPETVTARSLIDAFHPERAIAASAEPVLRDLIESGQGNELELGEGAQRISTRRLAVDFERAFVLRPDGTAHTRRFAVGDFTSAPPAGAFARPGTNARIFRENDRVARYLLEAIAQAHTLHPDPTYA